jgi:hypothetical protein
VRKVVIGAGLAMLGLAVGACGGGGDSLTAAEVAARGDAVCNRLDGEVKAVAAEFPQITFTPEQMQELWQKLVPKVDAAIEDFEDLDAPGELEGRLDEAVEQARADREKLVRASASPEAAKALFDTGEDPFTATNEKLAAAGITACSDDDAVTEGDADTGGEAGTTTSAPAEETTTTSAP